MDFTPYQNQNVNNIKLIMVDIHSLFTLPHRRVTIRDQLDVTELILHIEVVTFIISMNIQYTTFMRVHLHLVVMLDMNV